jgi:hypothetical protein
MTTKLFVALALTLAVLIAACDNGGDGATPGPDGAPTPAVTDSEEETATPEATPAETPTAEAEVCQPNPDPATPEFQVIDQPSTDDAVTTPVTISGRIVANEATFQVTIFDADGNTLVDTFGMSQQTEVGELAPFSIDVPFDVDEATPACIWVYEASAMDGSSINVGQIPVTLSP